MIYYGRHITNDDFSVKISQIYYNYIFQSISILMTQIHIVLCDGFYTTHFYIYIQIHIRIYIYEYSDFMKFNNYF